MNKMKTLIAGAVLVAAALQVQADNVWTGAAADGLWTNGANWSLGVAPTNGQGNIILNDQTISSKITIGPGDVSTVDGDIFGPEWGMDWTIDGGSFTQQAPGFVWAPIGDAGDHCIIDVKNGGSLEVQELLLGDNWWFGGHPYVDLNITGDSYVKARGWMWLGGHVNIESGTLEIGGNINFDVSAAGYAQINITGGTLFCPGGDPDLTNRFATAISNNQLVAYGGFGDIVVTYDSVYMDYIVTAVAPPFIVEGSPTDTSSETTRTLEAVITDLGSAFNSAVLYLDNNPVATNSSPAGTTNTMSYEASGLLAGTHTGKVIVTGTPASFTNEWSFEVLPFASVDVSPTGWMINDSPVIQVVVVDGASTINTNMTELYLDGVLIAPLFDIGSPPTATLTYATSGLTHGIHTGKVVVAGSPLGTNTIEWTFDVVLEESKPISIVHHWDFDDGAGTTVTDIEGGADGTIIGMNYAWVTDGLDLLGNGQSGTWNETNSGSYVDLPNNLLGSLDNSVSFEATYVTDNADTAWLRVWDFGASVGGEGISDTGAEGVFLTSRGSAAGGPRVSYSTSNPAVGLFILDSTTAAITLTVTHVVWVYDADTGMNKLYHNGVLVDAEVSPAAPLSLVAGKDVNNWLGRSQWAGDFMFDGQLYDLRIYNGIMTPAEVTTHYNDAINIGGPGFAPTITFINVAGADVTLSWTADSVGSYSILRKTALSDGSWSTVVSNLPPGNLTTNVTASGADHEFYQIKGE